MKFICVDDERIMLLRLIDSIKENYPNAEIFEFSSYIGVEECLVNNDIKVAFLDIHIQGKNGLEIAKRLKLINPKLNIVFCTGYDEYTLKALELHASGYLLKPITAAKIKSAMDNLIFPITESGDKKIRFCCFGVFKAYCNNKPLHFQYTKTEELLAYLVDKKGELIKATELDVNLFDDGNHLSYISNLKTDLIKVLKENNAEDILDVSWGKLGIKRDLVSCDYYDWLDGKLSGINSFHGEYMSQYPWSEYTLSKIKK